MNTLPTTEVHIPAMAPAAIDNTRALEDTLRALPQVPIETHHLLHAGVYARTICVPAGVMLTGALIRVPTSLVISGDCTAYLGDASRHFVGYHVLAASAHRKQAFQAHKDTMLTMFFATTAQSVEAAEEEFTNEAHLLFSRSADAINHIVITGD